MKKKMNILILCLIVFSYFANKAIYGKNIVHRSYPINVAEEEETATIHDRFERDVPGYTPNYDRSKIQPVPTKCVRQEKGEWANCRKLYKKKEVDAMKVLVVMQLVLFCYAIMVEECIVNKLDPDCKNLIWDNYNNTAIKKDCEMFIEACGWHIPFMKDNIEK